MTAVHNLDDEILRNIGGKSKINLNEILRDFTDTNFEIRTHGESPYIDTDSIVKHLQPNDKKITDEHKYSRYEIKI